MPMTSKERMLTALAGGRPDRLPITIHQWQGYHLAHYMGGMDQYEAFRATGLDASICEWGLETVPSPDWDERHEDLGTVDGVRHTRVRVRTPDGELHAEYGSNDWTTYNTRHLCQDQREVEIFLKHFPRHRLDRAAIARAHDRLGDGGILRGFVSFYGQPGPWQSFCELVGTEKAIVWAADDPAFVHHVLDQLTVRSVAYVEREMAGARYDLIEHGGGAGSCTVISPKMFSEFCVPYDRRIIAALHAAGHKVTYHTCGGMMRILDRIPLNGCDASETLSPPGVGGNIDGGEQRRKVKAVLGSKVALIGGIDQSMLDKPGTAAGIRQQVRDCFADFGPGGGYVCSASDHFFHAPPENLRALAAAAAECVY
jgi:uroporphyrinogen-III decarboxylase